MASVLNREVEAGLRPDVRRRLRLAGGVAAAGAVVAWAAYLYALTWQTYTSHSDSANAVLAGRDLVTGNLFLSGWNLPQASYWSMDLPLYGLLSLLLGAGPAVVHAGPVAMGAALVLVAVAAARRDGSRTARWAAGFVVVLLLGLPHQFLTYIVYQGPWHVGTPLFCLIVFLLLLRRRSRGALVAAVVVLAAAVIGDALALAVGVLPLLLAGLLTSWHHRAWRVGLPAVGVAMAAAVIAGAVRLSLDHLGGFTSVSQPVVPRAAWAENVSLMPRLMGHLLGVTSGSGLAGAYRLVHLVGGAAVGAAVVLSALVLLDRIARRRSRPAGLDEGCAPFQLDDVLVLGFFGGIAAAVLIIPPASGIAGARYLPASLAYGVVLAGRYAGRCCGRWFPDRSRRALPLGIAAVLGLTVIYGAASLDGLRLTRPAEPEGELGRWLEARGLTRGYGDYWTSSDVVLNSGGRVIVRPLIPAEGKLHGFWYYAPRSWFPPSGPGTPDHRFLVFDRDADWRGFGADVASATFGPPGRTMTFGTYDVLVYDYDLGTRLAGVRRP